MGTYVYLTAEKKVHDKWELFAPMQLDYDWDNQLCPPLVLDGGWPSLAHDIIDANKNWRLPDDVSAEFKSFYTTQIKNEGWGFGWGMYKNMKSIAVTNSKQIKQFHELVKELPEKEKLRFLYWWG